MWAPASSELRAAELGSGLRRNGWGADCGLLPETLLRSPLQQANQSLLGTLALVLSFALSSM